MTELVAALIGIVAGAIASGALQAWQQERDRKLAAKVAARLMLGDLAIAEHEFSRILQKGAWPIAHHLPFDRQLRVWEAQRLPLAAGVDATDWTYVASAYQDIADYADLLTAAPALEQAAAEEGFPGTWRRGQPLTEPERVTLAAVIARLSQAAEVVAAIAAPPDERERIIRELSREART